MKQIYLDHAATTPLRPEVLTVMLPLLEQHFGNPSSTHAVGRSAKSALDQARETIACHLACSVDELTFTSGGTESNNFAIIGAALASRKQHGKNHLITSKIEHHAVLHAFAYLENNEGFEVTYLPVDQHGRVSLQQLADAIRTDTALISLMYGNNEVGTLQPVAKTVELAKANNVLVHVDAVQAIGHVPLNLQQLQVDYMSFSAHKINGPKGIGLLFSRKGAPLKPILYGGSQENNRRPGTENPAAAAGFAKALELTVNEWETSRNRMIRLREVMIQIWEQQLAKEQWRINSPADDCLPHILNVSFPDMGTETMLMNLDLLGVYASSGSACTSGAIQLSHVLKAMQLPEAFLQSAIRFSFGSSTTVEQARNAAQIAALIIGRP